MLLNSTDCCSSNVGMALKESISCRRNSIDWVEILFLERSSRVFVLITTLMKSNFWWGFQCLGNSSMALQISFLMCSMAPSDLISDKNSLG